MNRIDKVRVATATFLALLVVQTGVCLTSGTSRFDVQGRPGNHDSEQHIRQDCEPFRFSNYITGEIFAHNIPLILLIL